MALIEFAHSKEMFVIYLFHTAINLMAYFYCIFSHVTTKLNCIKVLFNTDVLIYAVEFEQEQMSISYPEIGSISLSYSDFYKIIETKNYFTMFYKKNLPLIIVKNTLSVSEKSWKDFVAKQCICAKKIKFSS